MIMKINKNYFHHSIEKEDENTIWTCTLPLETKQLSKNDSSTIFEDAIAKVDIQSGKILFKKAIHSIIKENNLNEI